MIPRDELQLVGCASLWIASKYEEIYAPEVNDFIFITKNQLKIADIKATETKILVALGFDITSCMLPIRSLRRLLRVYEPYMQGNRKDRIPAISNYMLEMSLC